MKRLAWIILAACAALLSSGTVGLAEEERGPADPALTELLARVRQHYAGTTDFQAGFTQISEHRAMGVHEESAGVVLFRKPGMMRWDYRSPDPHHLISDGTRIWIYYPNDPDANRVYPFSELMRSRTPIALLSGTADLEREFAVAVQARDEAGGSVTLSLRPRGSDPGIGEVLLTLDERTLAILGTEVIDIYGNRTVLRFTDTQINVGITADRFTPPEGVEFIAAP